MKPVFEVRTVIARPVGEVWRELTDWERAPRWMHGVDSMHAEDGTRLGGVIVYHTRGKTRTSTISALDPGRSVTLDSVQGGVTARYTYQLAPDVAEPAQTVATLTAELATKGMAWVLMAPLLRAAVRRTDRPQLEALRAVLEQNHTRPQS